MIVRVLSSLAVSALVLTGPVEAQQAGFVGSGFRLSRTADFSSEDRVFAPADTLYVEVTLTPLPFLWNSVPTSRLTALGEETLIKLAPAAPFTYRGALTLDTFAQGEWTWSATAFNLLGRDFTPSAELTIASTPKPDFSGQPRNGVAPLSVSFEDLSTGTVTGWSWSFGDGATSTLASPSHVYAGAGTYTVALTATGPGGSATETKVDFVVVTEPAPVPDFSGTPLSGEAPLSVSFTDLSTGAITSWSWSFGDGGTSTQASPSHVYAAAGSYTVALTATGPGGSATETKVDFVVATEPAPVPDFSGTPLSGEAPLSVSFTDLSTGAITSWSWSFGDGGTSTLASPSHVYAAAGSYTVALTATGPGGSATETRVDHVSVAGAPEPEFAIRYGMNASENAWYQRGIAFADAMARASEFCTVVAGTITRDLVPVIALGQDPPLLGEGWPDVATLAPGERVGTRLFGSMDGTVPDGRVTPYVLTWEGTGACNLEGPAVVGEQNRTAQRVEVFVDPTTGSGNALLIWVVDGPDPVDPVRNAHVWLPGMEATRPVLWPPFVEKLATMNAGGGPSTWRAMDWCRVNEYGKTTGSAPFVFDLAGRIRPSSPSQGTKRGVCPEFSVALCNALGVDLHYNVPHLANDISVADYDAFLIDTLLRLRDGSPAVPGINGDQPFAGLAPGLTVTLELSNELWNPGFPCNAWMVSSAMASGRTLQQEIGVWVEHVFGIARSVFSGADAPRLRTFVGGRINDSGFLGGILGALSVQVDAVGPAAYFRPTAADISAWLVGASGQDCPSCPTPEEVVLAAVLAMPNLAQHLANHRALADAYPNPDGSHPSLELYEAGASFVANFQPWWVAAAEAQRIPDMYHAYVDDFVPLLVAEGVDQVNWYSFMSDDDAHGNGAGPFGHWDRMDQTITLPVVEPYLDEGAPKAAAMCKGPPLVGQ